MTMHMLLFHATICVSVEQLEWISLAAIILSRCALEVTELEILHGDTFSYPTEYSTFHREARDQYLIVNRNQYTK